MKKHQTRGNFSIYPWIAYTILRVTKVAKTYPENMKT
jgi:hypothetical protein